MKSENQKSKLLYIASYLQENSDENHLVTTRQLLEFLQSKGISCDRKTVFSDIDTLIEYGYDLVKVPGRKGGCYLASRPFEVAEVKLLVDLVQSSRFITEKKSRDLIKKLEQLLPRMEAEKLKRQVLVADRNKTGNETIYYTVDKLHTAMAENRSVTFLYFEWNEKKEQVLRKNGELYQVSPWLLTFDDQKYYLVAYDDKDKMIKHYRVDKMLKLSVTDKERQGREDFEKIDIASYSKRTFGMFAGNEKTIRFSVPDRLISVIVDRFGTDVAMHRNEEGNLVVRAEVSVSPQFFGWLSGLGPGISILAPKDVAEDYKAYLKDILNGL